MFKTLRRWLAAWAIRSTAITWADLIDIASAGTSASSGVTVNETSAFACSAFYSGVTLLSETIGSLPCQIFERGDDDSRTPAKQHHLARMLRRRANPEMSAMSVFETMQMLALGWGDSYAEIVTTPRGLPGELWPIHPSYVTKERTTSDELFYQVSIPGTAKYSLDERQVLHLRAPLCYGLIDKARETIGLSLATEKFGAKFFGNNAMPGTIFERDANAPKMDDARADKFMSDINRRHGGIDNAHRFALLPPGVKAHALSIAPEVAQFLETRRFQVEEIARFLRMPLHLLRETTHGVSYASIEVQSTEFLLYTLRPWLCRWEDELNEKLLDEEEQQTHFIEFNAAAILRADLQTRYNAYRTARDGGWLSVNEIRRLENMSPIDGGDVYLQPLNMAPAGEQAEAVTIPPPVVCSW